MTGNTDEMKRFMERLEKSNAGQENMLSCNTG